MQAPSTADSRPTALHAPPSLCALSKLRILNLAGWPRPCFPFQQLASWMVSAVATMHVACCHRDSPCLWRGITQFAPPPASQTPLRRLVLQALLTMSCGACRARCACCASCSARQGSAPLCPTRCSCPTLWAVTCSWIRCPLSCFRQPASSWRGSRGSREPWMSAFCCCAGTAGGWRWRGRRWAWTAPAPAVSPAWQKAARAVAAIHLHRRVCHPIQQAATSMMNATTQRHWATLLPC